MLPNLQDLSLQDRTEEVHANCKNFQHAQINQFPKNVLPFFDEVQEVATITHLLDTDEFLLDDKLGMPELVQDLCEFTESGKLANKGKYIGHDLLDHFDEYVPITPKQLEDMAGVQAFLERWKQLHGRSFCDNADFTIVCSRHNLIDLIMMPFSDEDVHLKIQFSNGYLNLSPDAQYQKTDQGIHSGDTKIKKICYTGFELENLITATSKPDVRSSFYSLVEGKLGDGIKLLLKAEMDCFNSSTRSYTEIKCSSGLKVKSTYHRRKLLRMWVQTSLVPSTNLLVGIRDPYYHQLTSFECYTRSQLYRKFNNQRLTVMRKNYNYNATISVQWFRHVIQQLCQMIKPFIEKGSKEEVNFRLTLRKNLTIKLRKMPETPAPTKGTIFKVPKKK